MTSNTAASVKQRLLNLSRTRKENFSFLLERYMLERFLYRLGRSPHRDSFLLKGAMLFSLWGNLPHRMTREPARAIYPAILDDLDAPQIEAYRMETTIAEKFHAMTDLGIRNSRLKDYFDIAWLVEHFEFEFEQVRGAIVHTFKRRDSSLPKQLPLGLTETFATDAQKNIQWRAFLKKTHAHQPMALAETVDIIVCFLEPVITSLSQDNANKVKWFPKEGWI
jgi:hypothetical protein